MKKSFYLIFILIVMLFSLPSINAECDGYRTIVIKDDIYYGTTKKNAVDFIYYHGRGGDSSDLFFDGKTNTNNNINSFLDIKTLKDNNYKINFDYRMDYVECLTSGSHTIKFVMKTYNESYVVKTVTKTKQQLANYSNVVLDLSSVPEYDNYELKYFIDDEEYSDEILVDDGNFSDWSEYAYIDNIDYTEKFDFDVFLKVDDTYGLPHINIAHDFDYYDNIFYKVVINNISSDNTYILKKSYCYTSYDDNYDTEEFCQVVDTINNVKKGNTYFETTLTDKDELNYPDTSNPIEYIKIELFNETNLIEDNKISVVDYTDELPFFSKVSVKDKSGNDIYTSGVTNDINFDITLDGNIYPNNETYYIEYSQDEDSVYKEVTGKELNDGYKLEGSIYNTNSYNYYYISVLDEAAYNCWAFEECDEESQYNKSFSFSLMYKGEETLFDTSKKAVIDSIYSESYNKISIYINTFNSADGYNIYRATSSKGTYKYIGQTYSTSFIDAERTTGKTYYYKVKAFYLDENNKKVFSNYSNYKSGKANLERPSLETKQNSSTSIKLSWNKISGAYGYKVYRAYSSDGKYSLIKTIKGSSNTTYTNYSLTPGKNYYYKVRAYRTVDGKTVYSWYSLYELNNTVMPAPTIKAEGGYYRYNKITITSKVSGAKGYSIFYSYAEDGQYYYAGYTTGTTYYDKKAIPGVPIYYKAKAFKSTTYKKYAGIGSNASEPVAIKEYVGFFNVSLNDYQSVKINLVKEKDVKEYRIYRSTSYTGTYKLIKTFYSHNLDSSSDYIDYINKGLTLNKKYYYKITYFDKNESDPTMIRSVTTKLVAPILQKSRLTDYRIELHWNKIEGSNGYRIYYSKDGGKFYELTNTSKLEYTKTFKSPLSRYRFKIRPYIVKGGKIYYGDYSEIV